MVASSESIAVVEGPNGRAEILEELEAGGRGMQYRVRFAGKPADYEETFRSMGEAYITAKEKAGVKA